MSSQNISLLPLMRCAGVLAGLLCGCSVRADVQLPALFGDHMVLQQKQTIPVWGKADPGESVTVTLGKRHATTVAGVDGTWRVRLAALSVAKPLTLTIMGKNTVTVNDVLLGEVWLCSGQSNMQFGLKGANNAETEIAAANYPTMRMFAVNAPVAQTPQAEVKGHWIVCSPQTAGDFTAVGYLFGREILQTRHIPVGLLHVSQGWTPAESWMSAEMIRANPDTAYIADRWEKIAKDYPAAKQKYDRLMGEWTTASATAKAAGHPEPPQPVPPPDPNFLHRSSGFWNGGVAPLIPYAIRGVVWYQGETNDSRAFQYRKLFPNLIRGWRKAWGQGDFPFLFVQLANVLPPDPTPVNSEWAELRESQAVGLAEPNTGMAVTIDIGEEKNVHPKNKQDVGHRLALLARVKVYGEKIPAYSPQYDHMAVLGRTMRVTFTHAYKGLQTKDNQPLSGFAIAGADHKFVSAQAKTEGNAVVVWADAVPNPVAVRYAWANNPAGCNLYNSANLPAVPFRTDDWLAKTADATRLYYDN